MNKLELLKLRLQLEFPFAKIEVVDPKTAYFILNRTNLILELTKKKHTGEMLYLSFHHESNPNVSARASLIISELFSNVAIKNNFFMGEDGQLYEAFDKEDLKPDDEPTH